MKTKNMMSYAVNIMVVVMILQIEGYILIKSNDPFTIKSIVMMLKVTQNFVKNSDGWSGRGYFNAFCKKFNLKLIFLILKEYNFVNVRGDHFHIDCLYVSNLKASNSSIKYLRSLPLGRHNHYNFLLQEDL